ncbi:Uncharacterised protein [Vibrio cholerae]|nr:Uncharacterised protein [Vibrio cholerae]
MRKHHFHAAILWLIRRSQSAWRQHQGGLH